MKRHFTLAFNFLAIFFISQNIAFSQDIMDLPPVNADGESVWVDIIAGDTTDTGERNNPNRIYRLERGGIYVLTSTLIANYPISIIAGGDDSERPPMIVRGKFADGVNIIPMMQLTGDGNRHVFRDIMFNGVDLNREYDAEWIRGMEFLADDMSVTFERCVFNAFTGGAIRIEGRDASLYVRDCKWRNGVWPTHMFVGQQVTLPELPVDTLIMTNNTYFNNNSFWIFQEKDLIEFAVIEHNTIFTSLIDMMRLRYSSNARIRSNLFYGTHAYGDSEEFQDITAYEPDGSPYSIISIYEVPSNILEAAGLTPFDRTIVLTHNAYFTPQPIVDYWNGNAEVTGVTWMNDRTQNLFNSSPLFFANNNVEKDPGFVDVAMDEWITGKVADFCITYRATLTPGMPLSGDAGDNRNYDEHQGVDILAGIQWPLPEDLAYSDAELLVGGHDGLPVGDLNWFPDKRAQYVEPTTIISGLSEALPNETAGYNLKQNYPNPFNENTVIAFTIPEKGLTTLTVYNMLGETVEVLVNDELQKGTYKYDFAAENMITGTYFYKLQSGDFVAVRKMNVSE